MPRSDLDLSGGASEPVPSVSAIEAGFLPRLAAWLATATPSERADAARAMARVYVLSDLDIEVEEGLEAAMTVLLDDPAPEVRLALADALAIEETAPRHIIHALAADLPEIAALVLTCSPLFIDAELVDIVAAAETALQVAVARRAPLSQAVAAAIAEVGEPEAAVALLDNRDAAVAGLSMRRIAERFGERPDVRELLLAREDLPVDVRQDLIRRLGDLLGSLAASRAWLAPDRAARMTRDACEKATVALAAETQSHDLAALAEHLRVTGQLTTALLLRALCAGNRAFFIAALAVLSRMPEARLESLVESGRRESFDAICRRAALPRNAVDAFRAAYAVVAETVPPADDAERYGLCRRTIDAVLARYRDITDAEAQELKTMLRRFGAEQARDGARAYIRTLRAA